MAQAQAAVKFPPRYSLSFHSAGTWRARWHANGSVFPAIGALVFAGMLAIALPVFAQHGGGGGGGHGGGGWGGGGGHSGGGFGGGGSHSGSRGGASARAGAFSNGAMRSGGGLESPGGRTVDVTTGLARVGSAFGRFFGLSHASIKTGAVSAVAPDSGVALINRAAAQASLPPGFSRVQLQSSFLTGNSRVWDRTPRASLLSAPAAMSVPTRPIWPRHAPYPVPYPVSYGGYGGFYPLFGFGFGSAFLDYFGAFNWFGPPLGSWNYNTTVKAPDVMLLYLNNGSAVEASDYWFKGDTLHYVSENGRESQIPLNDLDIQRTTDANARLGFRFTLDRTHRGTPLDLSPNSGGVTDFDYFAPDRNAAPQAELPTELVDPQTEVSTLAEAVKSIIPLDALDVSLSSVVQYPDSGFAKFTVQLKSKNLIFLQTTGGKEAANLILAAASLNQDRSILAGKTETMTLLSSAQDPILLPDGAWLLQVTIQVPRKTKIVRVAIEDQDGGRIGAVNIDRKTINAAPATEMPEPQLERRPRDYAGPAAP